MRRAQEPRAQTAAPRSPEPGGERARTRRTLAARPAPPACAARRPPCRSRWCQRPRGRAGPEYPRALSHLRPEVHSHSFAIRDKPACRGGGCRARWPLDPSGGGAGLSLQADRNRGTPRPHLLPPPTGLRAAEGASSSRAGSVMGSGDIPPDSTPVLRDQRAAGPGRACLPGTRGPTFLRPPSCWVMDRAGPGCEAL